jgi:hypothetical protein
MVTASLIFIVSGFNETWLRYSVALRICCIALLVIRSPPQLLIATTVIRELNVTCFYQVYEKYPYAHFSKHDRIFFCGSLFVFGFTPSKYNLSINE